MVLEERIVRTLYIVGRLFFRDSYCFGGGSCLVCPFEFFGGGDACFELVELFLVRGLLVLSILLVFMVEGVDCFCLFELFLVVVGGGSEEHTAELKSRA